MSPSVRIRRPDCAGASALAWRSSPVDVVVGDVRGVEQVDEHVLDTDVVDLLDDAVDLPDDLLRGQ